MWSWRFARCCRRRCSMRRYSGKRRRRPRGRRPSAAVRSAAKRCTRTTLSHASWRRGRGRPSGRNPRRVALAVGGLFFPQSKSLGIDRTEWSPELQRKLVYAGTNQPSFALASENVAEMMDLNVGPKQIERLTERIGAARCAERDAEVERYMNLPLMERKDKPAGVAAPDLAVVGVDGGRVQIRDDVDKDKSVGESAAAEPAAASEDENLPPDETYRGTHWREDKIGLLMTMTSAESVVDPCPDVPASFVDPTRILKLTRELKTTKSAAEEAA